MPRSHVALLRGINLGSHNKLAMRDLAEIFSGAVCTEVAAYILSGNIVFSAGTGLAARIASLVTAQIKERYGYDVPVVLRTAAELKKVISGNPFVKAGAIDRELHVMFLAHPPDRSRIDMLDPDRSLPDTFKVHGSEIYLRLPNGMGRTKLNHQYFEAKLGTMGTVRNWRTVTTLFDLMKA